jgi:hypothetical protein
MVPLRSGLEVAGTRRKTLADNVVVESDIFSTMSNPPTSL